MELLFVALVVVGFALLNSRNGKRTKKTIPLKTMRPDEQVHPASKPVAPSKVEAQPAPFDESTSKPAPPETVLVGSAWVTDGDTIKIGSTQIRLFGVDAPELDHPYGKKAKWALHSLCKGQEVRAEVTDTDEYGRVVARCFLADGRDLSAEMVKEGLALDWPKFSGGKYSDLEVEGVRKKLFLAAARQKGHMGVWKRFEEKQKAGP
ncbi:thermonuclease family protein [Pseudoruegeria sp. SHC-113]|uniref:thermonuclease family protein n=1 Tax=Pseudoruegeria sp. SHC-113 TaxID=2855439 RepID=UPI0021BB315E|nr:thermonuclease family protein [Pseudoruegeria sp. SHC-113]MCT8160865.1 thermonuclease family protein [Pseudoruegeria sp. SHC-113]